MMMGRRTEVTVIAGTLDGRTPTAPPPNSWAARPEADLAIWHIAMAPGATWELPPATGPDTVRTLYVFEGDGLLIGSHHVDADTGALVDAKRAIELTADGGAPVEILLLQGRPIGEPVARYGPFVMNTEAEIRQAFTDYQATAFGGWPWDVDAPNHGPSKGRFAVHADGRTEERELPPPI